LFSTDLRGENRTLARFYRAKEEFNGDGVVVFYQVTRQRRKPRNSPQ
jgi:hypothetical protein